MLGSVKVSDSETQFVSVSEVNGTVTVNVPLVLCVVVAVDTLIPLVASCFITQSRVAIFESAANAQNASAQAQIAMIRFFIS